MNKKVNKDNQFELVVGQCRHCHKTYQKLRYSYYILAMLCSVKCTILYYAKRYYHATRYYLINTGLFTPPFDTTNIEWRRANKAIIVEPIELKEITEYTKTILPTFYNIVKGQVVRFYNFITPIIKHNSYLIWRGANLLTAVILITLAGLVTLSMASGVLLLKSSIWITTRTTTLSIATTYILSMLLLQLFRILFIIPAIIFSIITIGFNTLVEPTGNFVKTLNHKYPKLPIYESLCLVIFVVYGSHNYTMLSAHANIAPIEMASLFSTDEADRVNTDKGVNLINVKEEELKQYDSPALSSNKEIRQKYLEAQKAKLLKRLKEEPIVVARVEEASTPEAKENRKEDSLETKKSALIKRLKEQEKRIKASRTNRTKKIIKADKEPRKDIIKKIVKTPKSKQLKERVMVASIKKTMPIKIKKEEIKPSIKKHIPIVKQTVNPLYAIPDFKRGNKRRLDMSFTFDGGSRDNQVDIVLETLKKNNVKTTFFLTGDFIDNYPNRVMQILAGGHEIANHTLNHPHLTSFEKDRKHNTIITKKAFLKQLKTTEQNYFEVTGQKLAPFWRAPYGEVNKEIISWAFEAGYIHVGWTTNRSTRESLDTLDWVADKTSRIYYSPEGIKNKILTFEQKTNGLRGGIVLMHLGTNRKSDNASETLDQMIKEAKKRGYRPKKVSSLYIDKAIMHPLAKSLVAPYIEGKKALAKKLNQNKLNSKANAIREASSRK